jgi:hypothetical protein
VRWCFQYEILGTRAVSFVISNTENTKIQRRTKVCGRCQARDSVSNIGSFRALRAKRGNGIGPYSKLQFG